LVARAQEGDMDAIGALYDQHHENIFRYVWLRVGNRHVAEDLTGGVFMRMLAALPNYPSLGLPFRAWLYRIAHNLLVDHYRRENHRVWLPLDAIKEHADDRDPTGAIEQKLLVERLGQVLSQLDQDQHEVVVLRFVVGLSLRETAEAMGKSEAAIKSLQHRSLATLRLALSQEPEQVIA
jgi:RNA polymerase sigma-70 factor (ECF subfamily)